MCCWVSGGTDFDEREFIENEIRKSLIDKKGFKIEFLWK
jgi:hypothetical protein